jgi:glycine cleavage system H protein
MPTNPTELKYTKDHEWARIKGKVATVGITHFAQEQLGDVVYVELPKVGTKVEAGKPFGVVESTKAVSELFAPLSGTVINVNTPLIDKPEAVNKDPYQSGWMVEIEMGDPKEADKLLTAGQYDSALADKNKQAT